MKIILSDFGFMNIQDEIIYLDKSVDVKLVSEENEFSGSSVRVVVFISEIISPIKFKCRVTVFSPIMEAAQVLSRQLADVLGNPRCPFCEALIPYDSELTFLEYGEVKCDGCNRNITELKHDPIPYDV